MKESTWKGMLTGAAGGLVGWWAIDRFYKLARASTSTDTLVPYFVGAGLGVAYGALIVSRDSRPIVRVPLGAAVYLADPERTAAPPKEGRDLPEKARNRALRLASTGLKKAAEMALFK